MKNKYTIFYKLWGIYFYYKKKYNVCIISYWYLFLFEKNIYIYIYNVECLGTRVASLKSAAHYVYIIMIKFTYIC